jgi:hypothetical protein
MEHNLPADIFTFSYRDIPLYPKVIKDRSVAIAMERGRQKIPARMNFVLAGVVLPSQI